MSAYPSLDRLNKLRDARKADSENWNRPSAYYAAASNFLSVSTPMKCG